MTARAKNGKDRQAETSTRCADDEADPDPFSQSDG